MSKGIKQYIRHTMPLELAEFLRKNKCTEKYINNVHRQLTNYCRYYKVTKNNNFYAYVRNEIYKMFRRKTLTEILYVSFAWSRTPEGCCFWSEISSKLLTFQEQYK